VTGQAASQRGALPPAAVDDEAFAALVLDAPASLAQGVEKAGLGRDPYRFMMGALAQALGVLPAFIGKLDGAIDQAWQPVDPVAVEQAVVRLEQAAVRGADRRAAELARSRNRHTLLTYGGVFAIGILAAASLGFAWGQASANATVHQTEQQLALAFRDGPSAAATWATLMRSNDANSMLATCTGLAVKTLEGRKACNMPVWLDPPSMAVPTRAR
jgi:hypothetical protein